MVAADHEEILRERQLNPSLSSPPLPHHEGIDERDCFQLLGAAVHDVAEEGVVGRRRVAEQLEGLQLSSRRVADLDELDEAAVDVADDVHGRVDGEHRGLLLQVKLRRLRQQEKLLRLQLSSLALQEVP